VGRCFGLIAEREEIRKSLPSILIRRRTVQEKEEKNSIRACFVQFAAKELARKERTSKTSLASELESEWDREKGKNG